MKLAAINIGVAHISGENRTWNRNFYGKERFDHEEFHLLQIYFIKLRD
jgi:hypothetical protein